MPCNTFDPWALPGIGPTSASACTCPYWSNTHGSLGHYPMRKRQWGWWVSAKKRERMMSLAHRKRVGYTLKELMVSFRIDSRLIYEWYNQKKSVRDESAIP
jgi:hypothetical protein